MGQDPFVAAIEEVAAAGRSVCESIESAVETLEAGAQARTRGVPLADVVDELIAAGGRDLRLATSDAFHEFERTLITMRAGVACSLVNDDRMSLTEVASRLHVSRQAVARLLRRSDARAPM